MNNISIVVEEKNGQETTLLAPADMGLSLMEFLKANDYEIAATCGGMALCATCHVEVLAGFELLSKPSPDEEAMLDTLPHVSAVSRLSCQIKLDQSTPELKIRIAGE
jgi:2Fe-2S ferredoxin